MNDKQLWTLLIVAAVVIGGWFLLKWWKGYQKQGGGNLGQLGTNLNSIAPELVGGSSGPAVAPNVEVPVTITLSETTSKTEKPDTDMIPLPPTSNPIGLSNPTGNGMGWSQMPEDAANQTPLIKGGPDYGGG